MQVIEEDTAYKVAELLIKIKKHVMPHKLIIGLTLTIIGAPLLIIVYILNIVNTDAAIWFIIDKTPLQQFLYLSKYCFCIGAPSIIIGAIMLIRTVINESKIKP
jgi:hypothetical protein